MSAMSASSGLMPLSLISEHKAAQGGPPPVQQLAFATEKHSLVQTPKPTPNGMEPSPPLVPVLPPSQPEPQPSLPCGGVSETPEEERSGGVVPEVEPAEPLPPVVPVFPEQPPAAEPAPPSLANPPSAAASPSIAVPSISTASLPSLAVPSLVATPPPTAAPPTGASTTIPQPVVPPPSVTLSLVPAEPQVSSEPPALLALAPQEEGQPVAKLPEPQPVATLPEPQPEVPTQPEEAVEPPAPVAEALPAQTPPVETQTNSSKPSSEETEAPSVQTKSEQAATPQPTTTPAPASAPAGRPPKRTKAASSTSEKKSTLAATATFSDAENGNDKRTKRKRLPTQVYQSPIPEENIIAKINKIDKTPAVDDKLIVFYRNEFLAVRNTEGSFYVCQAMQNVYKSSAKIRIRWLSQLQNTDHYSPDFYDTTEFDCILTNLNLERIEKNKFRLPDIESQRTQSILKRAIDVENGVAPAEDGTVTEEHPDGLDLSLYRNEDQLKKRKKGSKSGKKKIKKVITEGIKKSTREIPKRNKEPEVKKVNSIPIQSNKRVGRIGKVVKPVVQRIVAAKKMGRRKAGTNSLSPSSSSSKASPPAPAPAPPPATKEVAKKKETVRSAALKRKSSEPQPTPVAEKKQKTGSSKTRSGVAGEPSGPQQQQQTLQRARRTATRTK